MASSDHRGGLVWPGGPPAPPTTKTMDNMGVGSDFLMGMMGDDGRCKAVNC